jgi:RHS repeat-associated protein
MLTDSTGTAVWRAAYEAFGEAHDDKDPDGDLTEVAFNIRFPGQYYDAESGLHYNRFRYYDASVGRYVSADPIGQYGGPNVFAYAGLNPLRFSDRSGLLFGGAVNAGEAYGTYATSFTQRLQPTPAPPQRQRLVHGPEACSHPSGP